MGKSGKPRHAVDIFRVRYWYSNNGSMYITSEVFLPLGLPANHSFWTSKPQDWTSKKAWSGHEFPKDHAIHY